MSNIYLNISDIASFIGQNKWDYITPFERLWKRYDKDYIECLNIFNQKLESRKYELVSVENEKRILEEKLESKKITPRQYSKSVKEIEIKTKNISKDIDIITSKIDNISLSQSEKIEKDLGKEIIQTITNEVKDTNDKRKITNKVIENLEKSGKIKKDKKEELLKQTESLINKTHGTLKEDSAIKIFESTFNVELNTSQQYFKFMFKEVSGYMWYIGGKMDGLYIDENNPNDNYVVEVKNRTKGFFNSIRDYEKTQMQLYMLLTGFKKTKLVEKYNTKIRVTDVLLEQDYINDILEYLTIFVTNISNFFNNMKQKIEYFDLSELEKKKFLNNLYLKEIEKLRSHKEEVKIIKLEEEQDCLLSDLDDF